MKNDICFYSEHREGRPTNHHYADGIYLMEEIDGEIKPRCYVITRDDAESFDSYYGKDVECVELKYCCWADDDVLTDFTLIGNLPNDGHMLSKEYTNENYKQSYER